MAGEGNYLLTGGVERRRYQRIYVALVSPRRFRVDLHATKGEATPPATGKNANLSTTSKTHDLPVYDLSLGGFSCGYPDPVPTSRFCFTLRMEGKGEAIRGTAEVRAVISDGRIGCEIVELSEPMCDTLTRWFVDYILANARVRISEEEARAIVEGNSFL